MNLNQMMRNTIQAFKNAYPAEITSLIEQLGARLLNALHAFRADTGPDVDFWRQFNQF